MHRSDTATHRGNDAMYCPNCRKNIFDCVCWLPKDDFLDILAEKEQEKLFRQDAKAYIHNNNISNYIPIRKNLHSLSGMNGLKLLKKKDKR